MSQGNIEENERSGELKVQMDTGNVVSWAMNQNSIPIVHYVRIFNDSDYELEDLTVRIDIQPDSLSPLSFAIPELNPGQTVVLEPIELKLNSDALHALIEKRNSSLILEILDQDEQTLVRTEKTITVYACNQWSLHSSLPELLAAFILPNARAVNETLLIARSILKEETTDPSFNAYQSKSTTRVQAMINAIYRALQQLEVSDLSPQGSYESSDQKIRFPDQLIRYRMGTCLDIAVFLNACFEKIGLNPLIILKKGRALPGCWLNEDGLDLPIEDDPQTIRKLIEAGQILVFDPTSISADPPRALPDAIGDARESLTDDFLFALDVRAARQSKILPLPIASSESPILPGLESEDPSDLSPLPLEDFDDEENELLDADQSEEWTRVKTWKDKLLDLSLRNRLLNFRGQSKSVIPLNIPDLALFEDGLADNQVYIIEPKVDLDLKDPRYAELLQLKKPEELHEEARVQRFKQRRLVSELTRSDLVKRTTHIFRTARSSLQETGANTLYITLGMLEWYESEKAEKIRRAPILLIPVQLTRKRAGLAWRLSISDDETRVNSTLFEKLRKDFGLNFNALRELPTDDSGVHVQAIFDSIRKAIAKIPRWELKDDATLSLLSFTKYLMWLDLENKMDALLKNDLVHYLVKPEESTVFKDMKFYDAQSLDAQLTPLSSQLVLGADSSQQAAIMSAANGCHFVLQGPPGTGKSQTIANVIAHFLANNKTVLFVSEKMAALDVVYKRLQKVGLGDFCLELHSNKANKRNVCLSLAKTLDFESPDLSNKVNEIATSISRRRQQLNDYVAALHHRYPLGHSLYTALGAISEMGSAPKLDDFKLANFLELTEEQYKAQKQCLADISEAALDVESIAQHPLKAIQFSDWSPLKTKDLLEQLKAVISAAQQLAQRLAETHAKVPSLAPESRFDYLQIIPKLCEALAQNPRPEYLLLSAENRERFEARLTELRKLHQQRGDIAKALFSVWEESLLKLDLNSLIGSFRQYNNANFISRWWNLREPKSELYTASRSGNLPPNESILADLIKARQLIDLDREITPYFDDMKSHLGDNYKGGETDWDKLQQIFQWIDNYHELLGQLDLHSEHNLDRNALYQLASRGDAQQLNYLQALGAPFEAELEQFKKQWLLCIESLEIDVESLLGQSWTTVSLQNIVEALEALPEHWDKLRVWSRLNERVKKARAEEVVPEFLSAVLSGTIEAPQLVQAFEHSILDRFIYFVVESNRLLSAFEGRAQERAAFDFSEKDERFIDFGGPRICKHLVSSLPKKSGHVSSGSEVGLLLREAKKKARHKAIRKLLSEIPNLLPRLKPCFLMSPLSIAQYLPADGQPFDLVIFDEASQIPTHDAIGAIARGKQVVVVGDSKQLPPTSFFSVTTQEEEENPDDSSRMSELESILDECLASQVPAMMLKWHYRSRSEDLISFSNYHYYENNLNTFPAPLSKAPDFGLQFNYLSDAVYDKGATRTNKMEAAQCVEWVVNALKDPAKQIRSIGIVTFSIAQQGLIEDMFDVERAKHPEIEDYFSERAPEPVFVKNLENVQGDERDVILFSLCYGKDEAGKLSMNFGPLNREGGERRLNVAITRAREQLVVFSSLQAEDIDLSRTRARGAAHLKAFLRYARNGPDSLMTNTSQETRPGKVAKLETQLADYLTEKGWSVDKQVGCSRYRVDLAVFDPDNPEQYLMGIEGDGANYLRAATASDRDRIRGSVLEGLGWSRKRFWSMDWLYNKEKSFEAVHQALETLKSEPRKGLAFAGSNESIEPLVTDEDDIDEELDENLLDDQELEEGSEDSVSTESSQAGSENPDDSTEKAPAKISDDGGVQAYQAFTFEGMKGTQEQYLDVNYTEPLRQFIQEVIEHEAPIHFQELLNRASSYWDIPRQIRSIKKRLRTILQHPLMVEQMEARGEFYWLKDCDPATYKVVRDFRSDGSLRKFSMICPEEVVAGARLVLERSISLPREQLVKDTAKILGFSRVGQKSKVRVETAIAQLIEQGQAKQDGETITVL
ncbi:MAG: DUF4011 domain-containing protein [Planctomycetota bacterium]|nr:DUF4011 domain-containing protein [Planctomycetota bacterium]